MRRLMKMIMAALALAPALVWDGARWTWRVARAVMGAPAPNVADALAEADAVEAPPTELTKDEQVGLAALALIAPFQEGEAPGPRLPSHQEWYVRELTPAERLKLASRDPGRIGRHLRHEDTIPGLPVVPTAAEHGARILNLSLDIRDGVRPADIEESNRVFSLSVIEELLADLEGDEKLAA